MNNFCKLVVLGVGLLALGSTGLSGQTKLAPSATVPAVDGVIANKEYAWLSGGNSIALGLALSADGQTLYAALSAPTTGWVAVGLGSLRMNKSFMVMGFDNGTSNFTEAVGIGQRHNQASQKLVSAVVAKKAGSQTTLEFSIPAAGFTKGNKLDLILAYGGQADFVSMHRWNTKLSVPIGK